MAVLADTPVIEHFENNPHGTQVSDGQAVPFVQPDGQGAAGDETDGYFIGYSDCVTVSAAAGTVIAGTSDIVVTNGLPTLKGTVVWQQLGTIGAAGVIRLDRVRYAVIADAGLLLTLDIQPGEKNVVPPNTYVAGTLDGAAP